MRSWKNAKPPRESHESLSFGMVYLRNQVVMGPLKVKRSVASKRRYGIKCTKVVCGVCNRSTAPSTPPTTLAPVNISNSLRFCAASSLRYAAILATEPGQRATVLVAFAVIGATPVKMRAGKVMKLPPPATEFNVPPKIAATNSRHTWRMVILPQGPGNGSTDSSYAMCSIPETDCREVLLANYRQAHYMPRLAGQSHPIIEAHTGQPHTVSG